MVPGGPNETARTKVRLSNPRAAVIPGVTSSVKTPNRTLKKLRINLGLSPNALGGLAEPNVSGKAIRDAEERGTIPHPWNQVAIVGALNKLRLARDPEAELLEPTDVFPTERVRV